MRSGLRFRDDFITAIDAHIEHMGGDPKTVNADSGRRKRTLAACVA
jgi:hypothetical protein